MSDIEQKAVKELNKIADTIVQLAITLEKLENSEGKLKHFYEQEKALHEIKKIVRACAKLENLAEKNLDEQLTDIQIIESLKDDNLKDIAHAINKLEIDLQKLSENEGHKVKSFIHQKKAMHEIKKILHKSNIIANYNDEELKDIEDI